MWFSHFHFSCHVIAPPLWLLKLVWGCICFQPLSRLTHFDKLRFRGGGSRFELRSHRWVTGGKKKPTQNKKYDFWTLRWNIKRYHDEILLTEKWLLENYTDHIITVHSNHGLFKYWRNASERSEVHLQGKCRDFWFHLLKWLFILQASILLNSYNINNVQQSSHYCETLKGFISQ